MAYSPTTDTASGVETTFTIVFPYVREGHVSIKLDGVAKDHTFSADGLDIILDVATVGGEAILIERTTSTTPVVTWSDGTAQTETDLTDAYHQTLFLVEETDFRLQDPLARVYAKSGNNQAITQDTETDLTALTALTIPGADGAKKYRVNYLVGGSSGVTVTRIEVFVYVGATGTLTDGQTHKNKVGAGANSYTWTSALSGFEITPASAAKVGLGVKIIDEAGTVFGTGNANNFIEVVEIRE